jgi:hypothetical protein
MKNLFLHTNTIIYHFYLNLPFNKVPSHTCYYKENIIILLQNLRVRVNQGIRFPPNVTNFPLSAPPPRLLVTRKHNIAESGTLWEVHTLIYPDPKFTSSFP